MANICDLNGLLLDGIEPSTVINIVLSFKVSDVKLNVKLEVIIYNPNWSMLIVFPIVHTYLLFARNINKYGTCVRIVVPLSTRRVLLQECHNI
jgi:hypothetical protein